MSTPRIIALGHADPMAVSDECERKRFIGRIDSVKLLLKKHKHEVVKFIPVPYVVVPTLRPERRADQCLIICDFPGRRVYECAVDGYSPNSTLAIGSQWQDVSMIVIGSSGYYAFHSYHVANFWVIEWLDALWPY